MGQQNNKKQKTKKHTRKPKHSNQALYREWTSTGVVWLHALLALESFTLHHVNHHDDLFAAAPPTHPPVCLSGTDQSWLRVAVLIFCCENRNLTACRLAHQSARFQTISHFTLPVSLHPPSVCLSLSLSLLVALIWPPWLTGRFLFSLFTYPFLEH